MRLLRHLPHAIIFLILFLAFSGSAIAQPPQRAGYDIAWFDEFDSHSLDTSIWRAGDTNITTNNSLQDYLPEQVSVSGGNLRILSEKRNSRGRFFTSGLVETKAYQKYGRWDIRAKLPTSKGMWPAIWLLSEPPWPSAGEIDIMENRGDSPNLTSSAFHYGTNPPYRHNFVYNEQTSMHNGQAVNYHNSYHTYSVEWDPKQIRFYVDDVQHWTVRDRDVGGFLSNQVGEMRLIINTAIGGDFLDNPDGSTVWPQEFAVDYVHAYTRSATSPQLGFGNGGFESNGGSLADWGKFGDTSNNVSSGHEHVFEGDESLKLYGQFNGETNFSGIEQGISVEAGDELVAIAKSFISSADSILGSGNSVQLKIDYYSELYGEFGSDEYITTDSIFIADGSTLNDAWLNNELRSVVPDGAVEARLAIVFEQNGNAGGAVFVDGVQFSIVAVPEPSTISLVILGGMALMTRRRRRNSDFASAIGPNAGT